jgi:hypothetical protein
MSPAVPHAGDAPSICPRGLHRSVAGPTCGVPVLDPNAFILIGSHANRQNLDAFMRAIGAVHGASAALQVKDGFELGD